jgi:hypothetical protein
MNRPDIDEESPSLAELGTHPRETTVLVDDAIEPQRGEAVAPRDAPSELDLASGRRWEACLHRAET